jgi:hypothetical protein
VEELDQINTDVVILSDTKEQKIYHIIIIQQSTKKRELYLMQLWYIKYSVPE